MKQSDSIVKTLLGAKIRLQNRSSLARLKKRFEDANPVNRMPLAKALFDIRVLRKTKGRARKQAASDLVKMMLVKPLATPAVKRVATANAFCTNCGANVSPGSAFCGECGKKVA